MLTTIVFGPDGVERADGDELARRCLGDPDRVVWLDSTGPDPGDLECATELFGLHELAIEDVRKHGQRPKLEPYPEYAFLVAYARATDGDLCEVDFFVGKGWIVTVRERNEHGEMLDVGDVRQRLEQRRDLGTSSGSILYALLDNVVDGYFEAMDAAEDRLEDVEDRLFGEEVVPDTTLQQELLLMRRRVVEFRRRVVPLRDVVLAIRRGEIDQVDQKALLYFEDVLDHLLRVIDQIDVQRELVGNVVDASLAISGNRMNQVMKKMTSWGAILIVATLIAGVYGMNFENMPELHWRYGYFGAIGSMLVITGGMYLVFKKKNWL